MTEPEIQFTATGPMHDEGEQDDRQYDNDYPNEKHHDSGNGVPGYRS
jgi:hypothetical protein